MLLAALLGVLRRSEESRDLRAAQPPHGHASLPLTPPSDFESLLSSSGGTNRIVLINQYFIPADAARQTELDTALRKNLDNPLLHRVHILVENKDVWPPADLANHSRLERVVIDHRLSWGDGFSHAAKLKAADDLERTGSRDRLLAIVANADIWWDETLSKLQLAPSALEGKKAYVLARFGDNQDWCVPGEDGHADSVIFAPPVDAAVDADYFLGVQGTETRLIYELARQGYEVSNPCIVLKSHHEHKSNIRYYDPKDTVNGDGRKQGNSPPTDELPLRNLSSSAQDRE
tara:strand:+ start:355 stop:1221 length:867 start_codon:yes stop_codon:yes gene_type:complete